MDVKGQIPAWYNLPPQNWCSYPPDGLARVALLMYVTRPDTAVIGILKIKAFNPTNHQSLSLCLPLQGWVDMSPSCLVRSIQVKGWAGYGRVSPFEECCRTPVFALGCL